MNIYLKQYLLLVLILLSISVAVAQPLSRVADPRSIAYADPEIQAAIDFMINRLPGLIAEDKVKAAEEYAVHFANLNKLDEADVLYLVGHFYATMDQAKIAIPYFEQLINDPKLGEDARRMLNLLLYYRAVYYLQNEDKQASQDFLEDILNLFPTGKYYPTYLFLWADLIAESARHDEVTKYIENYESNRDWLENTFKPRKKELIRRIEDLALTDFYNDPTELAGTTLVQTISNVQTDLQTLYTQLQAVPGILASESLVRIAAEEMNLLDKLKNHIISYQNPPPLDLAMLASPDDPLGQDNPYNDYRMGAILLAQLKGTSDYFGKVIQIMDQLFDNKYELFINSGKDINEETFSDLEMKRLMDIEKNIYIYQDIIKTIDDLMADPNYQTINSDLQPERQEYLEKLADLQNRKERYIAVRKHQSGTEEALFVELLEEYYALNREKKMYDELLPEVEQVMVAMIKENYPKNLQNTINQQQQLAVNTASGNLAFDDNLGSFLTNLDFIYLQMDYRQLRYEEQQTQSQLAGLNDEEIKDSYDKLVTKKSILLEKHQDFIAKNPDFQALEQPSGGYLFTNAILYYNMAELQYAVNLDQPELALAYYRRVLTIDPDFFLKDYVLYNIAYTGSELKINKRDDQIAEFRQANPKGNKPEELKFKASEYKEAMDAYREIAYDEKYAGSPLRDEAMYRLGLLNFLVGTDAEEPVQYYAEANQCFEALIAKPDSKYAFEALYQRGWVNMNQGDPESLKMALGDFVTLIKAVDEDKIDDNYLATDYKSNSIDNVAYSLVALDGVEFNEQSKGVSEIQIVMADYKDLKVTKKILDKAASLKADMQAPLQAIDFMELRLQTSPMDINNPAVVDSIIKLYYTPGLQLREGTDLASIRREKYQFIKDNYNNSSAWFKQNITGADINDPVVSKQLAIIKSAYEDIRIRNYNELVTTGSQEAIIAYNAHLSEYNDYRELFGDGYAEWQAGNRKNDIRIKTILAEKRKSDIDYYLAYQGLTGYNNDNPHPANEDYFNNEGLAYKYAKNVFQSMDTKFGDSQYKPEDRLPANAERLYQFFVSASERYYTVLNSGDFANRANRENAAQIMIYLADIEIGKAMPDKARTRYLTVLSQKDILDNETIRSAYINLAQIEEKVANYPTAENYYRNALTYALDAKDAEQMTLQVRLQIQNNKDMAEQRGDYALVADENTRLAEEFKTDATKYAAYRYQASQAYKSGRMYQKAIDYKLELARSKTTIDDKYFLYYESWGIADSLLSDKAQARSLKNEFIAQYPSSNIAFNLRVDAIEEMRKVASQRKEAAEMYLALHDEVRRGRIDSGSVIPETIYLWAVDIYRAEKDMDKTVELLSYFTKTYPNHPQKIDYLMILADEYLARGDNAKFESYAREIYYADNTKSDRYLFTAQKKLGGIASDFDTAYAARDWTTAFRKRDEYKATEASYIREGLKLDNPSAYDAFTFAEKDYEELQAKLAYLKTFDRQLSAIEQGSFLNTSPNELIMVNMNTTWKSHLFGGKYNRIPNLKDRAEAEYGKIVKLLEEDRAENLDNSRRLRALTLVARINDYAADVTDRQFKRYLDITYEMYPFKDRKNFSQAQYDKLVNEDLKPYVQDYTDLYYSISSAIYTDIYNKYVVAGYTDQYTSAAISKLRSRDLIPDYEYAEYPLNDEWTTTMSLPEGGTSRVMSGVASITTPQGQKMGTLSIPVKHTLTTERTLNLDVVPEFVQVNMAYPFDPEIYVNDQKIDVVYVPVDTLTIFNQARTRYTVFIPGNKWNAGRNSLKGVFVNESNSTLPFALSTKFAFSKVRLSAKAPEVSSRIPTNTGWMVVTADPVTQQEFKTPALLTNSFDVSIDRSEYLAGSAAQAIWTVETPESMVNDATFEIEFELESPGQKAFIDFVAPDYATILLNGSVIVEKYPLNYDNDPFVIYPYHLEFPQDKMVVGKNVVRIMVNNLSLYRGMLAEIYLNK